MSDTDRIREVLQHLVEDTATDLGRFLGHRGNSIITRGIQPLDYRTVIANQGNSIIAVGKALIELLPLAATDTDRQAQAGAALYWAIYYAPGAAKLLTDPAWRDTVCAAFARAQDVFGAGKSHRVSFDADDVHGQPGDRHPAEPDPRDPGAPPPRVLPVNTEWS